MRDEEIFEPTWNVNRHNEQIQRLWKIVKELKKSQFCSSKSEVKKNV